MYAEQEPSPGRRGFLAQVRSDGDNVKYALEEDLGFCQPSISQEAAMRTTLSQLLAWGFPISDQDVTQVWPIRGPRTLAAVIGPTRAHDLVRPIKALA